MNTQTLKIVPVSIAPTECVPFRVPKEVVLQETAINALIYAAKLLREHGIGIIVKRGYFPITARRKYTEKIAKFLFTLLYPYRRHERDEIFSSNNHESGNAVDIGIYDFASGRETRLLGILNAFTPLFQVKRIYNTHHKYIRTVTRVMQTAGFTIHPNPVEQLQMHFELQ